MIAGGNLLSGCLTCGSPDQVNLEGTLSGLVGSGLVMQTNSSSPGFTIAGGGESTTNKNISSPNTLFVALVMLFLASTSAFAADEDVPPLSPGMRVRILAPELSPSKVMGTVNRVNDDSVTLDVPGRSEPVSISREKIARLDVSDGPRSRGVDATIGGVIGAAIGAAGCAWANRSGQGHLDQHRRGRRRLRTFR